MEVIIRPYVQSDRPGVRSIFGTDEFVRPKLLAKYPRFSEYLADEMSYYTDNEPEGLILAGVHGGLIGVVAGAVDIAHPDLNNCG